MKNSIVKLLLYVAVPAFVIIFLFRMNTLLGFAGMAAYILVLAIINIRLIYNLLGHREYQKGDLDKAAYWFGKAVKGKNSGTDVINYGFILLKTRKIEEAEKIFLDAIKYSKTSDDRNLAKSNYALVLWKKGELDNAVTMLKEVITEYKTTSIYGSLGYLSIEKGDLEDAIKINLEAYDYNPENAIIQDNLAHLYHLRGEMDKAEEIFNKLIESKPYFPEAYFDYGKYLEDCGKTREAAEMYEKALTCRFSFTSTVTKEQIQECYQSITEKLEAQS